MITDTNRFIGRGTAEKDYTQFGEQGLIEHLLGNGSGYAVEVGAADGVYMSTTKALEDKGWTCLCIEPNPFYLIGLHQNRKMVMPYALSSKNAELVEFHAYDRGNGDMTAGSGFSTDIAELRRVGMPQPYATHHFRVPVRTLDYCLAAADFPRVDFVSIDTEGHDIEVLRGFNIAAWNPKLVMVEVWDGDRGFEKYFEGHPYQMVARVGVNDIYLRHE